MVVGRVLGWEMGPCRAVWQGEREGREQGNNKPFLPITASPGQERGMGEQVSETCMYGTWKIEHGKWILCQTIPYGWVYKVPYLLYGK